MVNTCEGQGEGGKGGGGVDKKEKQKKKKRRRRSRRKKEEEQLKDLSREEFLLTHRAWGVHRLLPPPSPVAERCPICKLMSQPMVSCTYHMGSNEISSSFYQSPRPGLSQTSGPTTLFSEWYSNVTQPATKSKKHA